MAGILNYTRYLETLQTLTELGNTFPSNQTTLKYYVSTPATTDGWTATITWATLIIDQYAINSNNQPDFTNSLVYGYYQGGTATEYSTGTISLPQYMYTGPILPASLVNLPVTVVNISWIKDQMTYDVNLALIQNWEPGVTIADPRAGIDFEPVYGTTSTFTLTGPAAEVLGKTATFIAVTDIPIDMPAVPAYLYREPSVLIASSTIIDKSVTFSVNTTALGTGTFVLYAAFGGYGDYSSVISNTLSFTVSLGIPLIRQSDSITPSLAKYNPTSTATYELTVIPDPSYPPSSEAVTTTNQVKLVNWSGSSTNFYTDRFYDGKLTATFTISNFLVDVDLTTATTVYTITSWSTNSTVYTATYLAENSVDIVTVWDYQTNGPFSAGSVTTSFISSNTGSKTQIINDFPLTLTVNTASAVVGTPLEFTVSTTSSGYSDQVRIWGKLLSSSTYNQLYSTNSSLTSGFTATISLSSTGTWTLYADYPGDFGQSVYWANRPSVSTSVLHTARQGNILDATLKYRLISTGCYRIFVEALTTSSLTNSVSFYNGVDFLTSATWQQNSSSTSVTTVLVSTGTVTQASPSVIFYQNTWTGSYQSSFGEPGNRSAPMPITYSEISYPPNTTSNVWLWNTSTTVQNMRPWFNWVPRPNRPQDILYIGDSGIWYDQRVYSVIDPKQYTTWNTAGSNPTDPSLLNQLRNVANRSIQSQDISTQGEVNPNIYRAWRYYDGTNYDLNTTTAYQDILDPIAVGTWTATFERSYLPGSINVSYPGAAGGSLGTSFADNSRVYLNDLANDFQFDVYDIYKTDLIGDTRGYNVIGLTTSVSTGTVLTFGPSVQYDWRVGRVTSGHSRRYAITLTNFIGTITQSYPIQTQAEYQNNMGTGTAVVYLYEFSPTVRQANRAFKSWQPWDQHIAQLPANTYHGSGRVSRIAMSTKGIFRLPNNASIWPNEVVKSQLQTYNEDPWNKHYGRKEWNPTFYNSQIELDYTDFCNAWYWTFVANQYQAIYNNGFSAGGFDRNHLNQFYRPYDLTSGGRSVYQNIVNTAPILTTTITTVYYNTWTAEISTCSVNTATYVQAIWPGTLGQAEYGNYEGFDLRADFPSTGTLLVKDINLNTVNTVTDNQSYRMVADFNTINPGLITYKLLPSTALSTGTAISGASTSSLYPLLQFPDTGSDSIVNLQAEFFDRVSNLTVKSNILPIRYINTLSTVPISPLGNFSVVTLVPNLSFDVGTDIIWLTLAFNVNFAQIGSTPASYNLDQFARVFYTLNGYSSFRDFQLYTDWNSNTLNITNPRTIQSTRFVGFDTIRFVDLRGAQPFFWLPRNYFAAGTAVITRIELRASVTGITTTIPSNFNCWVTEIETSLQKRSI